MTQSFWTHVSALLSVALGWLLSEISQMLRGRKEDKKIRKRVLFYLLELHFTLKQLDIRAFIETVANKIAERMPKDQQSNITIEYLQLFYQQLIGELREKETADRINELQTHYKKSVEDLSLVDPIASYKLLGETEFFKLINTFSAYLNSLAKEFPNEAENVDSQTKEIIDFIKPELLKSTLKKLENEIKQISLSIGFITWYRATRIIDNSKKQIDVSKMKRLNAYLDKFIPNTNNN